MVLRNRSQDRFLLGPLSRRVWSRSSLSCFTFMIVLSVLETASEQKQYSLQCNASTFASLVRVLSAVLENSEIPLVGVLACGLDKLGG